MKKIGAYLLLFIFIFSFTTVPLGILISEEFSDGTQPIIAPHNHVHQWNLAVKERFFPMQNRFQTYKQKTLLFPEHLYISYGKGSEQNGFDIIEKNRAYILLLLQSNQKYLEYQLDLPMFHMIDKLKLPDQIKGMLSFS